MLTQGGYRATLCAQRPAQETADAIAHSTHIHRFVHVHPDTRVCVCGRWVCVLSEKGTGNFTLIRYFTVKSFA